MQEQLQLEAGHNDDNKLDNNNITVELEEDIDNKSNDDEMVVVELSRVNHDSNNNEANGNNMNSSSGSTVTPLPKLAMIMISLIIISEAVGFSILYPVMPFMARDFLLAAEGKSGSGNRSTIATNMTLNYGTSLLSPTTNTGILSMMTTLISNNSSIIGRNSTIGVGDNEKNSIDIHEERIGLLVGILVSAYSFAQLLSNWFISRASDHLGRKPFLLSGLIVNIILLTLFAFSKNFWFALVVRSVNGALNANLPIYHSFVVDITDDSNQEKAFVVMSIFWAVSNVVSPGLGGWLCHPAHKWPFLFGGEGNWFYNFFYSNPYVLPISVPILMNIISLILCSILMKESLNQRFDIVKWISRKLFRSSSSINIIGKKHQFSNKKQVEDEETIPTMSIVASASTSTFNLEDCAVGSTRNLLEYEEEKECSPQESVEQESLSSSSVQMEIVEKENSKKKLLQDSAAATEEVTVEEKQEKSFFYLLKDSLVIRVCILYLFLGFAFNTMDEMFSIFASNSTEKRGLSLDSSSIGIMLSIGGFTSLITLFIFPIISKKFGFLNLFRISLMIYIINATIMPFSAELVKFGVNSWIVFIISTFCIFIKACSQELAYTCQSLLVNNSSPTSHDVGSTNGLAHIAASIGWASGPLIGGVLFNLGLNWADKIEKSSSWIRQVPLVDKLTFWLCAGVCGLTFLLSFTVPKSILHRRYEQQQQIH